MSTLRYTKEHEWILVNGDMATVGITDYAQSQLGDIVFIETPEEGKPITKGGEAAVVESVKAASEVYAPASGIVMAVNTVLADAPDTVNSDPSGDGWFFKISLSNPAELEDLMDQAAYEAYLKDLGN